MPGYVGVCDRAHRDRAYRYQARQRFFQSPLAYLYRILRFDNHGVSLQIYSQFVESHDFFLLSAPISHVFLLRSLVYEKIDVQFLQDRRFRKNLV